MKQVAKQVAQTATGDSANSGLYKLGGVAAMTAALLILGEVIVLALYPLPATVSDWFILFQNNRFLAILDFWGLEMPLYFMFILAYLALYMRLRHTNESHILLALIFALLGIAIFFATNNPFAMLSLSNRYAAATTDAQRSALLAAGEALLANTHQRAVGGFNTGLFFVSLAGLLVSWMMVQSDAFGKVTAYIGLLAHTLSLADYLRQLLTPSALLALLVILPNALFLVVWYWLAGRKLYRLGRSAYSSSGGSEASGEVRKVKAR